VIKKIIQHHAFYRQKDIIDHKVGQSQLSHIYSGCFRKAGKEQEKDKAFPDFIHFPV
jgi:hypothetical protein